MDKKTFYQIDWSKIGGWATLVAVSMITYYGISAYRSYLEIKQLKKEDNV